MRSLVCYKDIHRSRRKIRASNFLNKDVLCAALFVASSTILVDKNDANAPVSRKSVTIVTCLSQKCIQLAWDSGCVMDCHATARGSNPGRNGVKTKLHVLSKGQYMGVPSLNDLVVDGTLNTTNQPN